MNIIVRIEKVISNYLEPIKNKNDFMKRIDTYFSDCKGEPLVDENGMVVLDRFSRPVYINQKIPTVSGLALALGMKTRKALLNYCVNGEYADVAKIAMTMLEEYAEMRLYDKNGSKGAMFSLCNSFKGWTQLDKDESSQEALDKLDAILEETKKTALANGVNTIMIGDKEVVIDVEEDAMIKVEEENDKDEITESDIANANI